jgi:hypothetical protein
MVVVEVVVDIPVLQLQLMLLAKRVVQVAVQVVAQAEQMHLLVQELLAKEIMAE